MADETVIAESSPAAVSGQEVLSKMTGQEYEQWKHTGELPKPKEVAESASADTQEETASEAEEAETAAESEPAKPEGKQKPDLSPKERKRVDKLTARNYELQETIERLTKQQQDLLDKLAERISPKEPAKTQAADTDAEPTEDKFTDWKEFSKAHARWAYRQEMKAAKEAEAKQSVESRQRETYETYNRGLSAARDKYSDFNEVVNDSVRIPKVATAAVIEMGAEGPEVAYYLGKHPDVCKQLLEETSDFKVIAELYRIADKLSGRTDSAPPPKKVVSGAPKPVTEVSAKTTAVEDEVKHALAERNYESYRKLMNAREAKAR